VTRRPEPLEPTTSAWEWDAKGQSANSPAEQQLWLWSIRYFSNRAGRIAVTEHIPGLSADESRTRARGRRKGHADPGVASGGPLGWVKAGQGIAWSLRGRSQSVWGCMSPRGVERPRRKVRFARLIHRPVRVLGGPSARAAFGGNLKPALVAAQGGMA
jgi:hypothetical protein